MHINLKEAKDSGYSNTVNEWADEYDKWVDDILKEEQSKQ